MEIIATTSVLLGYRIIQLSLFFLYFIYLHNSLIYDFLYIVGSLLNVSFPRKQDVFVCEVGNVIVQFYSLP